MNNEAELIKEYFPNVKNIQIKKSEYKDAFEIFINGKLEYVLNYIDLLTPELIKKSLGMQAFYRYMRNG